MAKDGDEPTPEGAGPKQGHAAGDGDSDAPTVPVPEGSSSPADLLSDGVQWPDEVPERIGPYKILQLLGEGGMGVVYLAEQEEPIRRRVALKVIKLGMDTKQVVARFEAERQALAMMDHPCIAKVFDAGQTPNGRPYFAMEYIRGIPISNHCDTHKLTVKERVELFRKVCDGVQHAHQKAVIHRDLKPSNILVTIQGDEAVAKIIDFGVAKATAQRLTERTLYTEMGMLIGTPEYMSPEQAEATSQDVDTRTDVYSLGVVLYELLVGALPFDPEKLRRAGLVEMHRVIREQDPPTPSTRLGTLGEATANSARSRNTQPGNLIRELRGDLDWITMKALEKDRTRRYGSPDEMAADLRRYLANEPVLASPPSTSYRAKKFVRRHFVGVGFAATLLLALVALAATMTVQAGRIARERDRANQEAQVANAALEFLTDLFEISDPSESRGNTITAREILDKGAADIETGLKAQPEVQARLMGTIGTVYQSLGLYEAAEKPLQEVLTIRRRMLGDEHIDVAKALEDLALLDRQKANYDSAESFYREALAIRRKVQGNEHIDVAWALSSLANVLSAKGDYEASEPLFRQALEMGRKLLEPDDPALPGLVTNTANVLADIGETESAEVLYREALDLNRNLYGTDHPEVAFAIDNLAMIVHDKGDYEAAEPLYFEAMAMLRRIYGDEHPEIAQTLDNVAYFLQDKGDYELSEVMSREALELNRKLLGDDHPRVADSLSGIAELVHLKGDHQEAERMIEEALAIYRNRLPRGHRRIVNAESALGAILGAQGRYEEAERLLVESYEALRSGGERAPEQLNALQRIIDFYESWGKPETAAEYRALLPNAEDQSSPN